MRSQGISQFYLHTPRSLKQEKLGQLYKNSNLIMKELDGEGSKVLTLRNTLANDVVLELLELFQSVACLSVLCCPVCSGDILLDWYQPSVHLGLHRCLLPRDGGDAHSPTQARVRGRRVQLHEYGKLLVHCAALYRYSARAGSCRKVLLR